MDTRMNDQQDEGRIDPEGEQQYVGGISEFARLEEERDNLIAQGVDPAELDDIIENGEFIPDDADTAALTGDERAFEVEEPAEVITDFDDTVDDDEPFVEDIPVRPASIIAPGMKDTNPKDGVGSLKPSYSSVPIPVLYEIGAALLEGARKYGGFNWRVAGVRTSVYIDATRRHLDAFMEGENIDPDSGLSHITKAIASLTVFRDAQINGMVANDDRPPSAMVPFLADTQERVSEIIARYPDPKPNYTQTELSHIRNRVVNVFRGQVRGFDIEVQLPGPPEHPEGFVWAQQGSTRDSLDLALSVAQALREDGYSERVVRVVGIFDRVEEMADGNQLVDVTSPMREQIVTAFPGDPSLTEE